MAFSKFPLDFPPSLADVAPAVSLLDTVLTAHHDGFALVDTDFRYIYINQILADINGHPPEAHIGHTIREMVGEPVWQRAQPFLEKSANGTNTLDLPQTRPDNAVSGGVRTAQVSYLAVPGTGTTIVGVAIFVRDTTTITQAAHADEAAYVAMLQKQRDFMRDVLHSVTDRKLHLCDRENDLPPRLPALSDAPPIALTITGGVRNLRKRAQAAALALQMDENDWFDMETAIGEAGMNAIVHAKQGTATVGTDGVNVLQVWVSDNGQGIAMENLPRAALMKGYTTAGTMGQGFKMILQTIDRLWLLTGENGTTLVMEKDKIPAPALVL